MIGFFCNNKVALGNQHKVERETQLVPGGRLSLMIVAQDCKLLLPNKLCIARWNSQ